MTTVIDSTTFVSGEEGKLWNKIEKMNVNAAYSKPYLKPARKRERRDTKAKLKLSSPIVHCSNCTKPLTTGNTQELSYAMNQINEWN